jgi:hypothetical protein
MVVTNIYEILVPTRIKNRGVPIEHHYAWDDFVKNIAGGLTVYRAAKGTWMSPTGKAIKERMIPVRIACTEEQIYKISDFTAKHYAQTSIMFYLISQQAFIKYYKDTN